MEKIQYKRKRTKKGRGLLSYVKNKKEKSREYKIDSEFFFDIKWVNKNNTFRVC